MYNALKTLILSDSYMPKILYLFLNFLVPSPCEKLECHVYARCVNGRTVTCQCPLKSECVNTPQSVCGSDGKTYDSICALQAESCENNVIVTLASSGKCGKKTSYDLLICTTTQIPRNSNDDTSTHPYGWYISSPNEIHKRAAI